jgi:hypothetical protein
MLHSFILLLLPLLDLLPMGLEERLALSTLRMGRRLRSIGVGREVSLRRDACLTRSNKIQHHPRCRR